MKLRSMIKAHYTISLYLFNLTTQPTGKKNASHHCFQQKKSSAKSSQHTELHFFFFNAFPLTFFFPLKSIDIFLPT